MKTLKLILGLFVVLLIVGCIQQTPGKTINTNGQASMSVEPDLAVVYVAIETLDESAEVSKDENSRITDAVYAELYKIGIDRENIETENFNIYEEFDWSNNQRESKGFRTSHTLKIKTEQFDDVGEIIDAVIDGGATRINYINFELSDELESEYKKQVLAEASKDAREKAEAIAEGLGATLGDLVSISDSSYYYQPYPLFRAEAGFDEVAVKEAVSTQISPKELEISANVQVVYKIK